ncbi:RteC domain-containing protein [Olivibacter sp. CPCC 100613]|uniref:RteC domain-containing protein n=1 Tax=Olivibacter sp. CPCC 100613 TaxID=3079931 RepID=UPI002FF4D7FE
MILQYADDLYRELEEELTAIEQENKEQKFTVAKKAMTAHTYLLRLRDKTVDYPFNEQEEITFFKTKKPKFASLILYFSSKQRMEVAKPTGRDEYVRKYYRYILKGIEKFFLQNRELYTYYRSGDNRLDKLLFLRSAKEAPTWLCPVRIDHDERFSTQADNIIAKIMAKERLVNHIQKFLKRGITKVEPDLNKITWTGESINLLETAYGWYCTGQLNNGQAGIGEIVRKLETMFNWNCN